ncbi:MAG: hypothetical protein N3J91_01985 [Verrucomicrobiae bacterium]|nr:hypothetical protein [Verrucomicrobiae bacterium]
MHSYPLKHRNGHLFVEVEGELWLLDTGSPLSFGKNTTIALAGQPFNINSSFHGLAAAALLEAIGVPCAGLLGGDVLDKFDHLLEVESGRLTLSTDTLEHSGESIPLEPLMGVPVVKAQVRGNEFRMFFDTGAQLSYFQSPMLTQFPSLGSFTDFYPGIGNFSTETYEVPLSLGAVTTTLRCGVLPTLLGTALNLANVQGIIGIEMLLNRKVGYFPRQRRLVL